MTRLGITLADIAQRVNRDRTTIQKQLVGASPLKSYVRDAIHEAITERQEAIDSFEWDDDLDDGTAVAQPGGCEGQPGAAGTAEAVPSMSHEQRPRLPRRDSSRLLVQLDRAIRITWLAHDLMAQHDVESVDDLLAVLNAQRERLVRAVMRHEDAPPGAAPPADAEAVEHSGNDGGHGGADPER
jgi:hypothetical protein